MPIKQNAKKALRQAKKHAVINNMAKKAYKDALKMVHKALEAGQDTAELLRNAQQKLDKAAKRGVIKSKTASRRLSRLMTKVHLPAASVKATKPAKRAAKPRKTTKTTKAKK